MPTHSLIRLRLSVMLLMQQQHRNSTLSQTVKYEKKRRSFC